MNFLRCFFAGVAFVGLQASIASASSVVIFSGSDSGASAPGTNSLAAAASFDTAASALASESVINFESPLTATNSPANQTITLNPSVNVSGNSIDIRNTLDCAADICGTNTTPGGSQWLELYGGTATFTFASPVQFFGSFLGGLQGNLVGQETITFSDNTSETVNIPSLTSGFAFVGFTDAGASITSVTIDALNDIISVDDVRYGAASAATTTTPEPAALSLLGLGLLGVGIARKKLFKK